MKGEMVEMWRAGLRNILKRSAPHNVSKILENLVKYLTYFIQLTVCSMSGCPKAGRDNNVDPMQTTQ